MIIQQQYILILHFLRKLLIITNLIILMGAINKLIQ